MVIAHGGGKSLEIVLNQIDAAVDVVLSELVGRPGAVSSRKRECDRVPFLVRPAPVDCDVQRRWIGHSASKGDEDGLPLTQIKDATLRDAVYRQVPRRTTCDRHEVGGVVGGVGFPPPTL